LNAAVWYPGQVVEHLDDNAASEFVSGSLPPSAIGRIEGHLATCRDCRALVAALAADSGEDSNAATFRHERISASQAGWVPRKTLAIGDRVGRYLVLSTLGAGGMGVVFAAYDPNLGRKIALKLLRSGLAGSSKDARNRLRREAQAIAQLSHPNVVSVYDVGTTDDGDLYIAMEFVEGDTLTTWLKKYPRTWREIVDVFVQAARGLASAHGVGLLHRDFKPDNVLVGGDGRVRVTDFGLARSVLAPDELADAKPVVMTALNLALTATGTVLGTPRYMPPEQLTGPELDARSDQFSFCVALYEALYGRHPLRDATSVSMLERGDRAQPPPEPSKVPAAIAGAVLRGLERERVKRWPSMTALIEELVPRPRRAPVRFVALATVAFLAVGGATAAVVVQQPAAPPAQDDRGVLQLAGELRQIKLEREVLLQRLDQARVDQRELAWLRGELARKDDEIQRLTDEVGLQILVPDEVARKPVKLAVGTTQMVAAALGTVQGPIEGCFREWAERTPGAYDAHFEAAMVVGLTVTPDGLGTLPRILSTPDQHTAAPGGEHGMSMLEQCVSEQIARARFTPGTAQLDIDATVLWSASRVKLYPKTVGQRQAPRSQIEMQ